MHTIFLELNNKSPEKSKVQGAMQEYRKHKTGHEEKNVMQALVYAEAKKVMAKLF